MRTDAKQVAARPPRTGTFGTGLTRRGVLVLGGSMAAAAWACDLSTEPDTQGESGTGTDRPPKGPEAPALAKRVEDGSLPPVEKRIPVDPRVVEPNDRAGLYGGRWRAVMLGPSDTPWLDRTIGCETLLRWRVETMAHSLDDIVPNVAESWEVNEDGTQYTIKLRAGMRWSDGEPYTADDIVFAVNDVYLNTELYPSPPVPLSSGDEPVTLERVDDYTVRFIFAEPNGIFPHQIASKNSGIRELAQFPMHYLREFHADYNDQVEELVEDADAPDWIELFFQRADFWNNVDLPRVQAWVLTSALNDGERIVFDRNPYYWKVDPDGSQLPYLDDVVYEFHDEEVMLLKATNGELDMYDRLFNTIANKPVLAGDRERGGYDFFELVPGNMNAAVISLNLTHEDPIKREIFNNLDFRIGLSHAINREEVIASVYQSIGEPWQVAPLPGSDYFDEEFAKQYTEYDVDLANEHLDRAGYSERDGDGMRVGPNGDTIAFTLEFATRDYGLDWASVAELIREYWREVGINVSVNAVDAGLLDDRTQGNQHDANIWVGDVGALEVHLDPRNYMPTHTNGSKFASPWAQWYTTAGASGEEPPEATRRQLDAYDQFKTTADREEQAALMGEIIQIAKEQFYAIGVCRPDERYGIVKNNFHNVPASYLEASNYPNPAPTNPEQYFIE